MSEIKADTPEQAAAAEKRIHTEVVPDTGGDAPDVKETPAEGQFLADFAANWGQYRARTPLYVGSLLAFAQGAQVPADHPWVETWLTDDLLERVERV